MCKHLTGFTIIVPLLLFANGCTRADPKATEREADLAAAKAELQKLRIDVQARDNELSALKKKLAELEGTNARKDLPVNKHPKGGTATFKDGKTREFVALSGGRLSEQGSFTRVPGELVFLAPKGRNELIIPGESIKALAFPEKGRPGGGDEGKSMLYTLAVSFTDGKRALTRSATC